MFLRVQVSRQGLKPREMAAPGLHTHKQRKENVMTCIPFNGHIRKNGYGQLYHKQSGKYQYARRVAYMEANGAIPAGLQVRHTCDNPACVNPAHLVLGSHADNQNDKAVRGRVRGSRNPNARLSEYDAECIRNLVDGGASQRSVAKRYSVSPQMVNNIVHRRNW